MKTDDRFRAVDGYDASHPADESLAAYVDGNLTASERLDLERHLAECSACRQLVSDTAAFLADEGLSAGRAAKRRSKWPRSFGIVPGLAAAAAVVLIVVATDSGWFEGTSSPADVDMLVRAFANEPTRLAEGRVTGGFRYAPPPAVTRGGNRNERSPDVRIAAGEIEELARRDPSPSIQWTLGLAQLAVQDYSAAVASLEAAARLEIANAELQSDLAAAYIARGRAGGNAADLRNALAATDRALALNSGLPAALFNRALALEALRQEATAAWRMFLTVETDDAWRKEAALHLNPAR